MIDAETIRRTITTIDAHAGGEPLRIVTSGLPPLRGATILERRREMLAHHDHLRRALMWEPRGHADMYGAIVTRPVTAAADYGVLFMHNEGYSTMCGHGIIALTTALIETGAFPCADGRASIGYDTPAGFVRASAQIEGGRVLEVAFENVPSFVFAEAVEIDTPFGRLTVPVVFGGAFYAVAEASAAGLTVERSQTRRLIDFGMAVKHGVEAVLDVAHPDEPELRGIYGTIVTGVAPENVDGLNVTIFADGEVDRSPCGTGTAGRVALLHATGVLAIGQTYIHQGVSGSRFKGRVLRDTVVAGRPAVVPEIAGRGFLTGLHTFVIEPDDPLGAGFLVR